MRDQLIGVWELKSFTNISEGGVETRWDGSLHGHLIYMKEDVVSVAINRQKTDKSGETIHKNSFYTGRFKIIDSENVEHTITESSLPDRIGSKHKRSFRFENEKLFLRGKGLTGEVQLEWAKVKVSDGN